MENIFIFPGLKSFSSITNSDNKISSVSIVVSITLLPRESIGIFILRYGTCRSLEISFMPITTSGLGCLLVLLDLGFYFIKLKKCIFYDHISM